MRHIGEPLFCESDPNLEDYLILRAHADARRIMDAPDFDLGDLSDEEAARRLAYDVRVAPPRVEWDEAEDRIEETAALERHGGPGARALIASRFAPFTGNARLLRLRAAGQGEFGPPAHIAESTVFLTVMAGPNERDEALSAIAAAAAALERCLARQALLIERHNSSLPELLLSLVRAARAPKPQALFQYKI